ncbi:MAG: DUF2125 domain-containing protein [Caulobacteraceae bacterium]
MSPSLPDPAPSGKPRRLWLYAPFALLLALIVAWSGVWLWMSGQVAARMDRTRDRLSAAGYPIGWASRRIAGYPFRLDVDLTGARLGEPSGWSISAPVLKAEAFVFAPGHWVMAAPDGARIVRPLGGPVTVGAKVLRASIQALGQSPPRLSVEGLGLTFATPPGAGPFFLTAAGAFHLHTRAGPNDQGAIYVELDDARAALSGLVARIAGGKPLTLVADAIYSHASALTGRDWPSAVRAWSAAGGALDVRHIRVAAGEAMLDASAGTLTVGPDGRLRGRLTAQLRQAPRTLAAMGEDGAISPEAAASAASVVGARAAGPAASVTLDFEAGQTTLGPVAIGPAPQVIP